MQVLNEIKSINEQLNLFGLPLNINDSIVKSVREEWVNRKDRENILMDYGTFKDSLRAPIHRWFKYPAGYSYRFVEEKIKQYGLNKKHFVLDPFVGSGTTSIECKRYRVNSYGIEAHPFVGWVAQKKLKWDLDLELIKSIYLEIIEQAHIIERQEQKEELPELVRKCYSEKNLNKLLSIRNAIYNQVADEESIDFFLLALIDTIRNASKAATGWPYIGPTKYHEKIIEKNAFKEFANQVKKMHDDLEFMQRYFNSNDVICKIIIGDSRETHSEIPAESIDLALTSPPYLNNYDYADRTRLETYFLGWYKTWGEITSEVRDKLIISATTQIRRSDFSENYGLDKSIESVDFKLYNMLVEKIKLLSKSRLLKSGKKSYDFMVAGYFSDMHKIIKQVFNYLNKGSDFVLVLGDSAPYGVHIPTDEFLGKLGLAIGFSKMTVEELRVRGEKWKNNPQRHKVKLKEVILTLTK